MSFLLHGEWDNAERAGGGGGGGVNAHTHRLSSAAPAPLIGHCSFTNAGNCKVLSAERRCRWFPVLQVLAGTGGSQVSLQQGPPQL